MSETISAPHTHSGAATSTPPGRPPQPLLTSASPRRGSQIHGAVCLESLPDPAGQGHLPALRSLMFRDSRPQTHLGHTSGSRGHSQRLGGTRFQNTQAVFQPQGHSVRSRKRCSGQEYCDSEDEPLGSKVGADLLSRH